MTCIPKARPTLLLIGLQDDESYFGVLRTLTPTVNWKYLKINPETIIEVVDKVKALGIDGIVSTNPEFLAKVANWQSKKKFSLDDFAGSFWQYRGVPILALNPLHHLVTTPTGKFLFKRYLDKLVAPQKYIQETAFTWELYDPARKDVYAQWFEQARFVAVDIETKVECPHRSINCIGYGIFIQDQNGKWKSKCVVIPLAANEENYGVAAIYNATDVPKVFQNGQYDNAYLLRWGMPITNWLHDTQGYFHSWYAELPKRLDFITAFLLRNVQYWKHESETGNLEDYYRYNAKDCWATGNSLLAFFAEAPKWAFTNYIEKFPKNYPCLQCGMEGLKVNKATNEELRAADTKIVQDQLLALRKSLGIPTFNPGSPKQVLQLMHMFGSKDLSSSDEKSMEKFADRHPLNRWFADAIKGYRESSKRVSTYLDTSLWFDRLFYALNPDATDTARLASKKSFFWCGTQIQNIPFEVKAQYEMDEDFEPFEIDFAQSEARCVAYLSGDERLIATVESPRDYHMGNAELFFGIPYEEAWDFVTNKVKKTFKDIRDLSKRTNHGANYNMGAKVMLETMGAKNVAKAKVLLVEVAVKRLMADGMTHQQAVFAWKVKSLEDVCAFLLETYARTYPQVKGRWYDHIKQTIAATHMLISPLGWVRYCFGNPSKNKPDLNAYVAHGPQNLSVGILNRGFHKAWRDIQLPNHQNYRLKAQIHDSVFGQVRKGHKHLLDQTVEILRIPVQVMGSDGKTRTMIIPPDLKYKEGARTWGDIC